MDTEMDTVEAMRARLAFRDEVPGTFCDSCVHWEDMAWRQREQLKTARNAALEEAAKAVEQISPDWDHSLEAKVIRALKRE